MRTPIAGSPRLRSPGRWDGLAQLAGTLRTLPSVPELLIGATVLASAPGRETARYRQAVELKRVLVAVDHPT
jgi:hypothetical protein